MQYNIILLKNCIRPAGDLVLQNILQLLRKIEPLSKSVIQFIISSILSNCNFVNSWDNLPNEIVKIILKKEAREELIQKYINKINYNTLIIKYIIVCQDYYQEGNK